MILKRGFLSLLIVIYPMIAFGDGDVDVRQLASSISGAKSITEAKTLYEQAFESVAGSAKYNGKLNPDLITTKREEMNTATAAAIAGREVPVTSDETGEDAGSEGQENNNSFADTRTDEQKAEDLAKKKKAYDDAKATEQSTANKTLTAATTAATGLGMMNLAMGKSEQRVDDESDKAMEAYFATFHCTYGQGTTVKASLDEIELPGGNNEKLMAYRSEYLALAKDLKQRKESLGMKPGIEAETILDKAEIGLYDDVNEGITSGQYGSIYRAKFLNSEADQAKLDAEHGASAQKVKSGGIAAGAGALGGIGGNSLINGALGDKVKGLIGGKGDDVGGLADKAKDLLGSDGASGLADKAKGLLGGGGLSSLGGAAGALFGKK